MSGRGGRPLSDLLSKARKKQPKKEPEKREEPQESQPDAGEPSSRKKRKKAPDNPAREADRIAEYQTLLQSYIAEKLALQAERDALQAAKDALQAEKDALQAAKDALQDAYNVLGEESEAQEELLQRYKGNRRALEKCTDSELKHLSSEANTLLRSCVEEQYKRIQSSVNEQYEEAQKQDCEILKILECPICQEVCRDVVNTRCGHSFCKECLTSWLRRNKKQCPECRMPDIYEAEMRPTFALRNVIATLPKTDHEAKRIKNYTAEHASLCTIVHQRHARLCAEMQTIAAGALNRMER